MGKAKKRQVDIVLLILVVILVICGLVFLYSTSAYNGRVRFNDPAYYFKKQIFATALGILGMYVVSKMDYHIILRYAPAVYLIALGLSTAVLFFGQEYNGSRRWLSLGPLSFQPSEFAKEMCIRDSCYVSQIPPCGGASDPHGGCSRTCGHV